MSWVCHNCGKRLNFNVSISSQENSLRRGTGPPESRQSGLNGELESE